MVTLAAERECTFLYKIKEWAELWALMKLQNEQSVQDTIYDAMPSNGKRFPVTLQ